MTPRDPGQGESDELQDRIRHAPEGREQITKWIKQGIFFVLGGLSLYFLWPSLLDAFSEAERIRTIRPRWFLVMFISEIISFWFVWLLIRTVLPGVSWFVAATSQLVSNAVSRSVPGGAALGGATLYRMLAVSGIGAGEAASTLAATGAISTAALFAIPFSALLLALLGAPIPEDLWPAAVAGGVLFTLLVAIGFIAVRTTRPLLRVGLILDRVFRTVTAPMKTPRTVDPRMLVRERDRFVDSLGKRWLQAVVAAAGNWAFDYLTLIAALYSVGAQPRLSVVLLAYAGAAVLGMIPLTPGGFGFVEAGLYALLIISGIPAQDAGLATIVYRIFSLLLPIVSGMVAWFAFRRRYQTPILG